MKCWNQRMNCIFGIYHIMKLWYCFRLSTVCGVYNSTFTSSPNQFGGVVKQMMVCTWKYIWCKIWAIWRFLIGYSEPSSSSYINFNTRWWRNVFHSVIQYSKTISTQSASPLSTVWRVGHRYILSRYVRITSSVSFLYYDCHCSANTKSWLRNQMETFSALQALCAGNSPMFSLICAWKTGWVNNRDAGDLRRHRAHYYVIVMMVCGNRTHESATDSMCNHNITNHKRNCLHFRGHNGYHPVMGNSWCWATIVHIVFETMLDIKVLKQIHTCLNKKAAAMR